MSSFARHATFIAKHARRLLSRAAAVKARHLKIAGAGLFFPWIVLFVVAAFLPLPAALRKHAIYTESTRYEDREGRILREVRADDATRAQWVSLEDAGPNVAHAVVAAEDSRFYGHFGVDPLAIVRALVGDVLARRITSGASTLTMQLARVTTPHRRNMTGKLYEMALATRIEASLTKDEILEQYINRAPFGVGIRGVSAASLRYFDKAPKELSLAEAATLAAIPRGPAVYTIDRHPERVLRRRNRVLLRMKAQGFITADECERAQNEPLTPQLNRGNSGAPHLVVALEHGSLDEQDADVAQRAREVLTTIDRDLQREVENAAEDALRPLAKKQVTAASVIVLDNATGEILAYVGSPNFDDVNHGGQNDGVRAKRQPGSTLKPFVYGMLMERRDANPATILPDVEMHLEDGDGTYAPNNYDGRFHGPVRMREALGNSYNIPAVFASHEVGAGPIVDRLRALGLATLTESAEHYGDAIALGDGEVRLVDLANAYATLARGGVSIPVHAVKSAVTKKGEPLQIAQATETRVFPRWEADLITDMLKDKSARVASFGLESALDFPFDVAAKTGTSKGFRDNWTLGYTREVTVGVWVGNFDGSSMRGTSGITGAGPIFQSVMSAAMRSRTPRAFDRDASLIEVEVCPLSGKIPGKHCHHRVRELVPRSAVLDTCDMHVEVAVDSRNGLRATPMCDAKYVIHKQFTRLGDTYDSWARAAGIELPPDSWSPLCEGAILAARGDHAGTLRVRFPIDGSHFAIDPARPASSQMMPITVDAPDGTDVVRVVVDGQRVSEQNRHAYWPIERGTHEIFAETEDGKRSDSVRVRID